MAHHPHPVPERCLNCHHALHGTPYCGTCGQAAHTPARITLGHLLHELPHVVWHVDKGVIYTLQQMWRAPGHTIARYLRGERAPFFPPLSLLLLLAGVNSFVYLVLHIQPFYHDPHASARLLASVEQFVHFVTKYQAWMQVALLPLSALMAHLFLRRRTRLLYAEHLVAVTLLMGAFTGLGLLFLPALWYLSGRPEVQMVGLAINATMIGFRAWGFAQLLTHSPTRPGPARRWGRAIALVVADYLLTVVLFLGVLVLLIKRPH